METTITDNYWEVARRHEKLLLDFARRMRKEATGAEKALWRHLRKKQTGHKVYRQKPMGYSIPDFIFLNKRLLIELDGAHHASPDVLLKDAARDEKFSQVGYRTLRFTNAEVLVDPIAVAENIKQTLNALPDRPYPFPREIYTPSPPQQNSPQTLPPTNEQALPAESSPLSPDRRRKTQSAPEPEQRTQTQQAENTRAQRADNARAQRAEPSPLSPGEGPGERTRAQRAQPSPPCASRLPSAVPGEGPGERTPPPRSPIPSPAPAAPPLFLLLLLLFSPPATAQAYDLLTEARSADAARQGTIAGQLTALPRSAYEPGAGELLGDLLAEDALGAAATYVKLAGLLQREDLLDRVSDRLRERADVRRAVNLARVRCGNTARRDNLLKNLRKIGVDDDFVYTVVPLLVYTRDRAVLNYLWELAITENRRCHPADAETAGRIDCAYRIVEHLGTAVADFPVKIDEDHNLITTDYASALAEIRRWYAVHATDYSITTETY